MACTAAKRKAALILLKIILNEPGISYCRFAAKHLVSKLAVQRSKLYVKVKVR